MPPSPATATNIPAQIEALLSALIDAHRQMLALTVEHRAAIARADGQGVERCTQQQAALASKIASLDEQRARLVAALAGPSPATPTITAVAQKLPEPVRGRIVALAAALRELLVKLQREVAVVRAATQSLVAHMDGLTQQVARVLSHARLYGPRGRIDTGGPVACGLDLTH